MAIQFVGGAQAGKVGATSGNTTIALNSGLAGGIAAAVSADDLVVAVFATGATADRTLAITDGTNNYTLIGSELYSNDLFDTNLRVAYKFMGGSPDASTTFGPTGNAADSGAMGVYVFRGVDTATPLDVAVVTGSAINTSRVVPPDITPSTAGSFVVVAGAAAHNGGVDTFTSSDLVDFQTIGGGNDTNDVTLGIGHIDNWASGPTNAATWGHSQADSADFSWAAITLALRPTAAAPVTVTPGTASLSITELVPTVTATNHQLVTPSTASLSITEFAPTVSFTANVFVVPDTKALSLATFVPVVTVASPGTTVVPDTASLSLTTFAPTVAVTQHQLVTPGTRSLALATFIPVIAATSNQLVTPSTASLILTRFAPRVLKDADDVGEPSSGGAFGTAGEVSGTLWSA